MTSSVLIVEDDEGVQKFLREFFLDNGFAVRSAKDGTSALNALVSNPPDVIILDLGLPNMSGEVVCTEIKKKNPEIPIIILTARDTVNDIIGGLNLGADDYMTKPFSGEELLARVKARLRAKGTDGNKLTVGDLELDPKSLEVKRQGRSITLTPLEYKLLHYLMANQGRVLTRDMILNRVWLYSPEIESRVVDIYIGYLRKKIDAAFDPKLLQSVRGFGYMIKNTEKPNES